jgi:hypothetical protein
LSSLHNQQEPILKTKILLQIRKKNTTWADAASKLDKLKLPCNPPEIFLNNPVWPNFCLTADNLAFSSSTLENSAEGDFFIPPVNGTEESVSEDLRGFEGFRVRSGLL